jgi:hypothetical protein
MASMKCQQNLVDNEALALDLPLARTFESSHCFLPSDKLYSALIVFDENCLLFLIKRNITRLYYFSLTA